MVILSIGMGEWASFTMVLEPHQPTKNCISTLQFVVGWCGSNTIVNEAHSPMPMDKMTIFPSAVQCGHAAHENVLEWYIPEFGSAPRTLVRAELVQGVKQGEKFVLGYSDARSDCRSSRWVSPRGQVVARAIVAVHYSILVRTQSSLLINNRTELVVTNEVRFIRKQKDMRRSRTTKAIQVTLLSY